MEPERDARPPFAGSADNPAGAGRRLLSAPQ